MNKCSVIKKVEMGGTCSTHGICMQHFAREPEFDRLDNLP